MKVWNASVRDLQRALKLANAHYEGNIEFGSLVSPEQNEAEFATFTLSTKDSRGPGGRLGSFTQRGERRIVPHKACWHAHGHFFEAVFKGNPKAVITTPIGEIRGPSKEKGNWRDAPVVKEKGVFYSNLCSCGRDVMHPAARVRRTPKAIIRGPRQRISRKGEMRPEGLLRRP